MKQLITLRSLSIYWFKLIKFWWFLGLISLSWLREWLVWGSCPWHPLVICPQAHVEVPHSRMPRVGMCGVLVKWRDYGCSFWTMDCADFHRARGFMWTPEMDQNGSTCVKDLRKGHQTSENWIIGCLWYPAPCDPLWWNRWGHLERPWIQSITSDMPFDFSNSSALVTRLKCHWSGSLFAGWNQLPYYQGPKHGFVHLGRSALHKVYISQVLDGTVRLNVHCPVWDSPFSSVPIYRAKFTDRKGVTTSSSKHFRAIASCEGEQS